MKKNSIWKIISAFLLITVFVGTSSVAFADTNVHDNMLTNISSNLNLKEKAISHHQIASIQKNEGTPSNPYLIRTPQDLELIRNNLTASFKLMNDINMSGVANFVPFGIFQGQLDGNGKVIKNLTIECNWVRTGFIALNAGKIQKLGFENINVKSVNSNSALVAIGGIVAENQGSIENCYITGAVTNSSVSTVPFFGSIVGYNNGGNVTYCYTTSRLNGILAGIGQNYTGIMIGFLDIGNVTKSYYLNVQGYGKGRNNGTAGQWTFENLPLSDTEFKAGVPFTGWDTSIWNFSKGQYPSFKQPWWTPLINVFYALAYIYMFAIVGYLIFGLGRNRNNI